MGWSFLRTSREEIAIIHVAVHSDYAPMGSKGDLGLGVILVEKVKEIAARIVGWSGLCSFTAAKWSSGSGTALADLAHATFISS